MKNTLEILKEVARTVYNREPNNLAYIDESEPESYYTEYTVGQLCREELRELAEQLELWEEIKRIASININKYDLNEMIRFIVMQIPLNDTTRKLFEEN